MMRYVDGPLFTDVFKSGMSRKIIDSKLQPIRAKNKCYSAKTENKKCF